MITTVTNSLSGPGVSIGTQVSIDSDVFATLVNVVTAGKTGTLTTRTDNNTGTLTMTTGHGLTTSARVDIHWVDSTGAAKCQHKVTLGTVSGDSVPFDLGVGDNLPSATTAVVVSPCVELDVSFLVAEMEVFGVGGSGQGKLVLEDGSGTIVFHQTIGTGGSGLVWTAVSGATNPVSDDVVKAFVSNGNSAATNTIQMLCGLSG